MVECKELFTLANILNTFLESGVCVRFVRTLFCLTSSVTLIIYFPFLLLLLLLCLSVPLMPFPVKTV